MRRERLRSKLPLCCDSKDADIKKIFVSHVNFEDLKST